jgi:hypothetical protein
MAKAPTDIRSLARQHTALAIRTLVGIAAQKTAPQSARVAAATALMDRGWGKPKQEVEINQEVTISLIDSLARIAQMEHHPMKEILGQVLDNEPEEVEVED